MPTPVTVDICNLRNPDLIGELLREASFTNEGFGCLENFNMRPQFKAFDATSPTEIWRHYSLFRALTDRDTVPDMLTAINEWQITPHGYANPNGISAGWIWDGDGSLAFAFAGIAIVNHDCKKTYGWQLVPASQGMISPVLFWTPHTRGRRPEQVRAALNHLKFGRLNHYLLTIERCAEQRWSVDTLRTAMADVLLSFAADPTLERPRVTMTRFFDIAKRQFERVAAFATESSDMMVV